MTVKNGLNKLAKLGKVERESNQAKVIYNGYVICFRWIGEGNDDASIISQRARQIDDIQSEYLAGHYFSNLSKAIKYVQRQEAL